LEAGEIIPEVDDFDRGSGLGLDLDWAGCGCGWVLTGSFSLTLAVEAGACWRRRRRSSCGYNLEAGEIIPEVDDFDRGSGLGLDLDWSGCGCGWVLTGSLSLTLAVVVAVDLDSRRNAEFGHNSSTDIGGDRQQQQEHLHLVQRADRFL